MEQTEPLQKIKGYKWDYTEAYHLDLGDMLLDYSIAIRNTTKQAFAQNTNA